MSNAMSTEALVRAAGLFLAVALVFGAIAFSAGSLLAQAFAVAALALSGLIRLLAASIAPSSPEPVRIRR